MTIADFVNSTGIKVIPLNPKTKAPICKWKNHPEYFTNNIKKLRNYWKAGFTAFAFIPARYGLVVLDIDIKNNINGLDNLKRIIADKEIIFPYDIYKNYFYVRTPSGGLHYYFNYYTGISLLNTAICPGVEIKHTVLITAPGSKNNKGIYIAHGDYDNIFIIPQELIKDKLKKKCIPDKTTGKYTYRKKSISLYSIFNTICRQYGYPIPGNRNIFCFQFSLYAKKLKFLKSETRQYLIKQVGEDFIKEIISTTNSAYVER